MRIATYNILNGGMGRLDPLAETLAVIDADVVALEEANDPDTVEYLARKLDADFAIGESPTGPFHVAILSKLPITQAINLAAHHPSLDRAALEARIEANGRPMRVIALHLSSGLGRDKEMLRLSELKLILDDLTGEDIPTVLAGDFNAHASYHPLDVHAAEPTVRQRLQTDPTLAAHDLVQHVLERGWIDAYHHMHPDDPAHTFTTAYPATRVDYIFIDTTLAGRLTAAGVEQRGFAPYCSDHFPLWADLSEQAA